MGEDASRIRQEIADTRERMGQTVEALSYKTDVPARAKDAIQERKDAVVNKFTDAKDAIVGKADAIAGKAGDAGDAVAGALPDGEQIQRTAKQAVSVAQENPLGLAVGALAIGFLAGMVLPSTRVEDEHMGPAAHRVKDRVLQTGQEAIEHTKEVANEALQAAAQTVQEQAPEHAHELAATAQGQFNGSAGKPAS